jgi:DNA-binding beta-propeller fold protein YncE
VNCVSTVHSNKRSIAPYLHSAILLFITAALYSPVASAGLSGKVDSQDFGKAEIGASTAAQKTLTYSFSNLSAAPSVGLSFALDFKIQSQTCSATACSVVIVFGPQYPGLRQDGLTFRDSSGNVIATTFLHGIGQGPQASVHPGIIATYAGTGEWGIGGDGSAAISAKLSSPQGVAIDPAGNLYIADSVNQVIRKVDATGKISTYAGSTGLAGSSGDGGLELRQN